MLDSTEVRAKRPEAVERENIPKKFSWHYVTQQRRKNIMAKIDYQRALDLMVARMIMKLLVGDVLEDTSEIRKTLKKERDQAVADCTVMEGTHEGF